MTDRVPSSALTSSVFVDRWSTRAFVDEPLGDDEVTALFDAARWAPSWMNNQPWIFVYDTEAEGRRRILETFMERNRSWASSAPLVGLVLAHTELTDFMARTRDFDTGAAAMSLALQATMLGLSAHMLGGIDVEAAHALTETDPATTTILCGFVVGRRGDPAALPEGLRERELPSQRKPLDEIAVRLTRPDADEVSR